MNTFKLFGADPIHREDLMMVEGQSADFIVYLIPLTAFFTLREMFFHGV
jgi:hypothetical protein